MPNENCLEGLRCPECKQADVLQIAGTSLFRVVDDGTESHEDVEWDGESFTRCPPCGFKGKLSDFFISAQVDEPEMKTYEVVIYETRRFEGRVKAPGRNEVNLLFQTGDDVDEHCNADSEFYAMEIKDVQEVKGNEHEKR